MAEKSPLTPSPNVAREKALKKPARRDSSPLAKNQVFMTRSKPKLSEGLTRKTKRQQARDNPDPQ